MYSRNLNEETNQRHNVLCYINRAKVDFAIPKMDRNTEILEYRGIHVEISNGITEFITFFLRSWKTNFFLLILPLQNVKDKEKRAKYERVRTKLK